MEAPFFECKDSETAKQYCLLHHRPMYYYTVGTYSLDQSINTDIYVTLSINTEQ